MHQLSKLQPLVYFGLLRARVHARARRHTPLMHSYFLCLSHTHTYTHVLKIHTRFHTYNSLCGMKKKSEMRAAWGSRAGLRGPEPEANFLACLSCVVQQGYSASLCLSFPICRDEHVLSEQPYLTVAVRRQWRSLSPVCRVLFCE